MSSIGNRPSPTPTLRRSASMPELRQKPRYIQKAEAKQKRYERGQKIVRGTDRVSEALMVGGLAVGVIGGLGLIFGGAGLPVMIVGAAMIAAGGALKQVNSNTGSGLMSKLAPEPEVPGAAEPDGKRLPPDQNTLRAYREPLGGTEPEGVSGHRRFDGTDVPRGGAGDGLKTPPDAGDSLPLRVTPTAATLAGKRRESSKLEA